MKKETELRVLKFSSTYHYRFLQIFFYILSMIAMKGIIIPDFNGSRKFAVMMLAVSLIVIIIFQFLITAKHERIEKAFNSAIAEESQ
ncbi:hypothetical protein MHB77_30525 [Paenibacillus sp. FSL K6-3166]|uniref:hypothetical protein n=1 Tax=Paenibacillus sp. FSL K6-3166 TaxID=2921492 RepID=UPI0030FBE8AE